MWLYIQSEAKKIFRDGRLYAGSLLLLLLLWYAFQSQHNTANGQRAAFDSARIEQSKKWSEYTLLLDSVYSGKKEIKSYAADPRNPVYFSQRLPQYAQLSPQPLHLLATGQSDLYNEQLVLNLRFRDPRTQRQDMNNPLLLRFGTVDPAMVLAVLLPLFIIALSFNFLSGEREGGTLSLVAVQASSVKKWLWAKTLLYGTLVFLITWTICSLFFFLYSAPLDGDYFAFSALLLAYVFFWQLLAVWVNGYRRSSAFNALVLVGAWTVFVFLIPATVNLLSGEAHPVPSRVSFINTVRMANVEAEKADSSKLVDQFFYDHPELAEKKDTAGQGRYAENAFWKEIVVQSEFTDKKAEPIYANYVQQLNAANRFTYGASTFSPSAIFYQSLIQLSGKSTERYLRFSDVAMTYRKQFLNDMRNRIITDKEISPAKAKEVKPFVFEEEKSNQWLPVLWLLFYSSLALFFILKLVRKPLL